jgi:hypothetical protein
MSFSVAPLLLHSTQVPLTARHALRAAYEAPLEERILHLESAARILHRELDLNCLDARELVGLSAEGNCGAPHEL